jgi:hypothetical protein
MEKNNPWKYMVKLTAIGAKVYKAAISGSVLQSVMVTWRI